MPGSDFGDREQAKQDLLRRYRALPQEVVHGVFRRHGSLAAEVLGDGDIGVHYGAGLCEREVRYFKSSEWAHDAEDVLWRRTKAGLHLDARQQALVAQALA